MVEPVSSEPVSAQISLINRERTGKNFDFGSNWGVLIEFDPDSPRLNSTLQANSLLFN